MSGYYVFNPFTKKMDWTEAGTAGSTIDLANNLKPLVSTSVNVLEINTKSGGEVPDSVNFFTISIPDGSGYTNRTRKAQYLSGDSKITLADAANYWSKGTLDAEIKTCWLQATGITQGSDIAEYSAVSVVVKQSGFYSAIFIVSGGAATGVSLTLTAFLKTGSSTYSSATYQTQTFAFCATAGTYLNVSGSHSFYLNSGDTIHLGAAVAAYDGNRRLLGDNSWIGGTALTFKREG